MLAEDGTLTASSGGASAQVTPEAVTNCYAGDMNQDLILDGTDLTLMWQILVCGGDFVQTAVGDVNGDGVLDTADAALLQRKLLGMDVFFAAVQLPSYTIVPAEQLAVTTAPSETTVTTTAETTTEETSVTTTEETTTTTTEETPAMTTTAEQLTLDDLPSDYAYAADWIWTNRIEAEQSTER